MPQTASRTMYYGYWIIAASFVAQFTSIGIFSYTLGPFMTPMTDALGWVMNWGSGTEKLLRSSVENDG